jgi:PKD repeat protein
MFMKIVRKIAISVFVLAVIGLVIFLPIGNAVPNQGQRVSGIGALTEIKTNPSTENELYVSDPVVPTLSIAVRDLPDHADLPILNREPAQRDNRGFVGPDIQMPLHGNLLADLQANAPEPFPDGFVTPILNFAGVQDNSSPPDDTGDVGLNHFLQADNGPGGSRVTVYDKAGNYLDQFYMADLASSAPCNNGYCDPIVQYDELADRWMIAELPGSVSTLCVYISATPDPLGQWWAYAFTPPGGMQDYPKYGVWPDGYYVGVNNGGTVIALERAKMLNGQPATMQTFNIGLLPGFGFQLTIPATLEGAAPPAGAPVYFLRPRDTEIHGGSCPNCDLMEMWSLHVDWVTPSNSTLISLPGVQLTDWDQTLCGTGSDWSCMPQPGTSQKIDPIREPLHYPLQYRNFGTYETLVGCFAEDVDGTDHAAVHWFEIRRTPPGSGAWVNYQEGVVGDGLTDVHRSVCSAAMDGSGNIAVGYTRTGGFAPYYPSIYYSGRRATDPLGTMPYYDNMIWDATTSKTNNERWGDYSGIGVDPADNCTFWYTTEYGGSGQTRIAAFKFDECTGFLGPDFTIDAAPETLSICAPDDAQYDVSLDSVLDFAEPVNLVAYGTPAGTTASFSINPVTPTGNSVLTISDTELATQGLYNIDVVGIAATRTHTTTVGLELYTDVPIPPTLLVPEDGATNQPLKPSFDWDDLTMVSGYNLELALSPLFDAPLVSAMDLIDSAYVLNTNLEDGTCYWWHTQANNLCGTGEWSEPFHFATIGGIDFFDDMEGGESSWIHEAVLGADHWQISDAQSYSPVNSWYVPDDAVTTDSRLLFANTVHVSQGSELTFWHRHNFQKVGSVNYDGGVLEISIDNGATWQDLGDYMTANGYNGYLSPSNPLGVRKAWVGDMTTWKQVVVDLNDFAGQDVLIRWRFGANSSGGDTGWYIDDVKIATLLLPNPAPTITSIMPNSGTSLEPTEVQIFGSGFWGQPALKLGDTWLLSATVVSSTTIEAVVPAGLPEGTYSLTLYNGDCQMVVLPDAFTVVVEAKPIEGLTAINDSPTGLGGLTTLTATITAGTGVSYLWDFGDETMGMGQVATHVYPTIGVYTAVVTASNNLGSVMTTTMVTIVESEIGGLTATNDSPTAFGALTTLTATITSGMNVTYDWNFGDGITGTGDIVTHIYPEVGVYEAVVTATNETSLVTATTSVTITEVPIEGLSAVNDSPTILGNMTTLTATVIAGSNVIYTWDFGDGSTGSGMVVMHTYTETGVYTATVTATNSEGNQVATTTVVIEQMEGWQVFLPIIRK